MIEKIYENKYGVVIFTGLEKDLDIIKTDERYLYNKATGSKFINIENPSNSLIWDNEDKIWITYDGSASSGSGTSIQYATTEEVTGAVSNILNN